MNIKEVGLDELRKMIDSLDFDLSDLEDIEILARCSANQCATCNGTCISCNGVCQKCNEGASNGNSK